jgi:hypothetical protein
VIFTIILGCGQSQTEDSNEKTPENQEQILTFGVSVNIDDLQSLADDAGLGQEVIIERLEALAQDFVDIVTNKNSIVSTHPIGINEAKKYHNHFWSIKSPKHNARGVLIELQDILKDIGTEFLVTTIDTPKLKDAIMYNYFIAYDADVTIGGKTYNKDDRSVLVQLGKYQSNSSGKIDTIMIPGRIYDYGDLCPPNCPNKTGAVYGD